MQEPGQQEGELPQAVAYGQQGVWLGRGFAVEPAVAAAVAGGTSGGRLAVDAGTGSDLAATAESAEQPTDTRERERVKSKEQLSDVLNKGLGLYPV